MKKFIYWLPTTVVALVFAITGIGNLLPFEHIATDMKALGYPPFFMLILGTWKIAGAIVLLIPRNFRLKEWAYAGILFDLTGAALSRIAVGSPALEIIIPLMIATATLVSYFNKNSVLINLSKIKSS